MKITLRGKNAKGKKAIVDKKAYKKVLNISPSWYVDHNGYAATKRKVNGKWKTTYMHRVITGDVPGKVFRKDKDRIDNRSKNLIVHKKR